MTSIQTVNVSDDEALVATITRCQSALQVAIHAAVESGLKVTVAVEAMHGVGEHYSEPLVEVDVERVIKLT